MSQPKRDTTKPSPVRLVLVLLASIFTIEFGIMAFFLLAPSIVPLNAWVDALIDSFVLSILLLPVLFFIVFRPLARQVNELEQAEKELEGTQAILHEALRMKSEFMTNVTHELRTPLNSVIGFAELLQDEVPGPLNAKQAAFATDILASGQHLLALVEGILEMSRLDAGGAALEREPVEIGTAIEERVATQRKAAEAAGVRIVLEVAADAGRADLDPKALRRMLDVLIDNAIKFNREGGTVTVSARRDDGWLKIKVADTGIGIARENLAKLFRPLSQLDAGLARQHGGLGLGLALARCLAELHGGTIEVESEPGKGSTFTLRLPIQEKS
jgi:signal transduction histidine kinase